LKKFQGQKPDKVFCFMLSVFFNNELCKMIILRFGDHLDHVDTVGEDNVKIKISA